MHRSVSSRRHLLPDLALLGIAAVWGGSYLATQELAMTLGAGAVLCARFLPAAVVLGVLVFARRVSGARHGSLRAGSRLGPGSLLGRLRAAVGAQGSLGPGSLLGMLRAAVGAQGSLGPGSLLGMLRAAVGAQGSLGPGSLLGMLRAATIVLETVGVTRTSATNAGLLIGVSILLTPLLESAFSRRRLTLGMLGSVSLALCGIALLVGGNGFARVNDGDALILAAAVTRAALGVAEARATRGRDSDLLGLTAVEIGFGAVLFTAWGGGSLVARLPSFTAADWGVVIYLSLGCTILAFLGQLWATSRTSASRAGLLLGSEPAWALGIGIVLGGERIDALGWVGAGVLLVAMLWGRRAEERWRHG